MRPQTSTAGREAVQVKTPTTTTGRVTSAVNEVARSSV
jgi:hypothetical protein